VKVGLSLIGDGRRDEEQSAGFSLSTAAGIPEGSSSPTSGEASMLEVFKRQGFLSARDEHFMLAMAQILSKEPYSCYRTVRTSRERPLTTNRPRIRKPGYERNHLSEQKHRLWSRTVRATTAKTLRLRRLIVGGGPLRLASISTSTATYCFGAGITNGFCK
jgi:hypothetical protein